MLPSVPIKLKPQKIAQSCRETFQNLKLTDLPLGILPKKVFWSLSGYKEIELTTKQFTGCTFVVF